MPLIHTSYTVYGNLSQDEFFTFLRGEDQNGQPVILQLLRTETPTTEQLSRLRSLYEMMNRCPDGVCRGVVFTTVNGKPCVIQHDRRGTPLDQLINKHTFDWDQIVRFALAVLDQLELLHKENFCYLNLNPATILVDDDNGQIQLIDFSQTRHKSIVPAKPDAVEWPTGHLKYRAPEQTGRINAEPDQRSDLYSLGVILYQLLTNDHPFGDLDPLETVHAHIATIPQPPHQKLSSIPVILSRIVMRLLAKAKDERYQSCRALRYDIDIWSRNRNRLDELEFQPGELDRHPPGLLPETVIAGRDRENEQLLKAFTGVRSGHTRLVLIAGPPGIGKTALVDNLIADFIAAGGLFFRTKLSQGVSAHCSSPIQDILRELLNSILTLTPEEVKQIHMAIRSALTDSGQGLIDVLPELADIVHPLAATGQESGPEETENQFLYCVRELVRCCGSKQRPLIFFLDDMQWADSTTIKSLRSLLTDPGMAHLLVICSYRDSEVKDSHPLKTLSKDLTDLGLNPLTLTLNPLNLEGITDFLSNLLDHPRASVAGLARSCLTKTSGNPFFLRQFLLSLVQNDLLYWSDDKDQWQWDIEAIQELQITDNAVEFITQRLEKLKPWMREILQAAACLDVAFTAAELAIVSDRGVDEVDPFIALCKEKGFLVREPGSDESNSSQPRYQFSHDQVQQAAYNYLTDSKRQRLHLKIGHLLLDHHLSLPGDESFLITEQFNAGRALLISRQERLELAKRNLEAGQRARSSVAYELAHHHFQIGLELLDDEAWKTDYTLTHQLHVQGAEAAYLSGVCDLAFLLVEAVIDHGSCLLDKVPAYEIAIQAHKAENQLDKAVQTGLEVLKLLGVNLPDHPGRLSFLPVLMSIRAMLIRKQPEDLINLPRMTDPVQQAIMNIFECIGTAAYYSRPELLPLIGFKALQISLRYGNTDQSTLMGYPTYGFLQCGVLGNIEQGYRFGQVALEIQKRLHNGQTNPQTLYLVANLISHWKEHLADSLPMLMDAYGRALATGNLEAAANAAYGYSYRLFLLGRDLNEVSRNMAQYHASLEQLGQKIPLDRLRIFEQAADNLLNLTEHPEKLNGRYCNEEEVLKRHRQSNDRTTLFLFTMVKAMLCYLFGHYEQALEYSDQTVENLPSVISSIFVPVFHFYDSLIRLAIYRKCSSRQQAKLLSRVQANQKKMRKWAEFAPMNFQHKVVLIQAEMKRVNGPHPQALDMYSRAAQLARDNHYLQEEALAYELAALYCEENDLASMRESCLREARNATAQWGAMTKIHHLDRKIGLAPAGDRNSDRGERPGTLLHRSDQIDMMTVVKASQALAGEIILNDLLDKLMRIMIESSGAQKGLLLFKEDDQWQVRVQGYVRDREIHIRQAGANGGLPPDFAGSVVNYVARTSSHVVLDEAVKEGLFIHDHYIMRNQIRSVFCIPIIHKDKTLCVLYLENNLMRAAFSPDREELLRHLGTQAAISLHNSTLYDNLNKTLQQLYNEHVGMTFAICKMAESRDPETGEHLERMREYCRVIASQLQRMGKYTDLLTDEYIECLYFASALHDIGKIGVPDAILQKPGRLTGEEFKIMQTHALIGQKTLVEVDRLYPGNNFISMGAEIAGTHHERWDGSGYPHALKGEDIPLSGRILALGDVYDALTARRVYKEPYSHEKSRSIILEGRGSHFDPLIVEAFLAREEEFIHIKTTYKDS